MFKLVLLAGLVLAPLLWLFSISALTTWRYFFYFFLFNLILFLIYTYMHFRYGLVEIGQDEYGLKGMTVYILSLLSHISVAAIVAIIFRKRKRTKEEIESI